MHSAGIACSSCCKCDATVEHGLVVTRSGNWQGSCSDGPWMLTAPRPVTTALSAHGCPLPHVQCIVLKEGRGRADWAKRGWNQVVKGQGGGSIQLKKGVGLDKMNILKAQHSNFSAPV